MQKFRPPVRQKLYLLILLLAGVVTAAPVLAQQPPASASALENRVSTLEDSMRNLNGQLEQITYAIRRLDQSMQRMQADYDNRLSQLEQQTAALQQTPAQAPAAAAPAVTTYTAAAATAPVIIPEPNGTLGALKVQDGRITGGVNAPQSPALPDAPADYGLTPQEQYDRAFGLLRQANYDEAAKGFRSFIDKNPKDKLIENAKYWYAETLYVRGQFGEAASAFGDAYQQNPQGTKAPDSLLKLAMSLGAIDKSQEACVALSQLKAKYPTASASVKTRASETSTKLKCSP